MGKFVKKHYDFINLGMYIPVWLSCLPLRFDKPEAIVQHELLVIFLFILVRHNAKQGRMDCRQY